MKLIVLRFPSLDDLIKFRLVADPTIFDINPDKKTLFCICTDHQLELAEYVYEARLLEFQPSLN